MNSPDKETGTIRNSLGSPMGSTGPISTGDMVNVVVTTAGEVAMLDDPTYENIIGLRNRLESFVSQGTSVKPMNHITPHCKRVIQSILAMQGHANKANWEQLPLDDLFRVLLEIFPKNIEMAGQSVLEYLASESPQFDYNVLDQTKLAKQFALMMTKLEATQHTAKDVVFAIKQLTNDIPKGVGGDEIKKFLMDEAKRLKPDSFEAYCACILKTQYETRKAVMEVIRRGVFSHNHLTATGPGPSGSASSSEEHVHKKPRTQTEHAKSPCSGCGKSGHEREGCAFIKFNHPDHNPDSAVSWRQSVPGKAWHVKGFHNCPARKTLSGKPYDFAKLEEFVKSCGEIGK